MRTAAPELDAAKLTVDIETPERRSGSEAKCLFQIVPFRARGFNRPACIAGPLDHGPGVKPCFRAAKKFVQHEPIGRRPMSGVAVAHHATGGHCVGNGCELSLRFQAIGLWVVELRTVDVQSAW